MKKLLILITFVICLRLSFAQTTKPVVQAACRPGAGALGSAEPEQRGGRPDGRLRHVPPAQPRRPHGRMKAAGLFARPFAAYGELIRAHARERKPDTQ